MRVRADIHALSDIEMRRAELVDEDERPYHIAAFARKRPAHFERAEIVSGRGVMICISQPCPTGHERRILSIALPLASSSINLSR